MAKLIIRLMDCSLLKFYFWLPGPSSGRTLIVKRLLSVLWWLVGWDGRRRDNLSTWSEYLSRSNWDTTKIPSSQFLQPVLSSPPSQFSGFTVKVTGRFFTTFFTFYMREIMTLSSFFMCLSSKMWRSGDNRGDPQPHSYCDHLANIPSSYQLTARYHPKTNKSVSKKHKLCPKSGWSF